jgi:S1-C subfamily serine protease
MTRNRYGVCLLLAGFLLAGSGLSAAEVTSRRRLEDYEADVYGPLRFSEEITGFIEHELRYLISRQKRNGSWDSAQPMGGGRTTMEAGGTVDNVTLTAMCAYSLRKYGEFGSASIDDSVARALAFVTYMIRSGKQRNDVQDSPWHYIYALRFLVGEHPNIKDAAIRTQVEDACAFIIRELQDVQQGTAGQRSVEFAWDRGSDKYPGTLGFDVRSDSSGVVLSRFEFLSNRDSTPLKIGDRIMAIDGKKIAAKADIDALAFRAGQKVQLLVQRDGKSVRFDYICAPVPAADFGVSIRKGYDQGSIDGFEIDQVFRGSCLRAAGLVKGDRLLSFDGVKILNRRHFTELSRSVWAGKKVRVAYLSGGKKREVQVTPPAISNEKWLRGYHGLKILVRGAAVSSVAYGSPAGRAGCLVGDKIVEINGRSITSGRGAVSELSRAAAGRVVEMIVVRRGARKSIKFAMNRTIESIWYSRNRDAGGGWGYLRSVKGGNSFTTADAMRELLKAKRAMPKLDIPDQMIYRAFRMLSTLRKKQPNSDVESYRYDAAGSFWRVQDIRSDIGRLCSAELACLMYTDAGMKTDGMPRTQKHLEKTLAEWLKHRGILDLVKFPKGHGKLSIAPWFWMYAYRTTVEAADYLTINDALREKVRRNAMNAFFKHAEFRYEEKLGAEGWIIGGDLTKELHDTCQMLDALATMKHLYKQRLKVKHPALGEVMKQFNATKYGAAHVLARSLAGKAPAAEIKLIQDAIADRFASRLGDIKAICTENPYDAMHHLKQMKTHFAGYEPLAQTDKLAAAWLKKYGPGQKRPPTPLEKALALRDAKPLAAEWGLDLMKYGDPDRAAVRGRWTKPDCQMISPKEANARFQLPVTPKGDYRLEVQFTRLEGDALAVMLPVGDTGVLLVVGGWGGRVSGLAYVGRKDANRNKTTRDGKLTNNVKHTLGITVRRADKAAASVEVTLDAKPYIKWSGPISQLTPDRDWRLRDPKALGLGAYGATIVFHSCRFQILDN